jgi:hypothetical protein
MLHVERVKTYYGKLTDSMDQNFIPGPHLSGQQPKDQWIEIYNSLSPETQNLVRTRLGVDGLKQVLVNTQEAISKALDSDETSIQQRAIFEGKPVGFLQTLKFSGTNLTHTTGIAAIRTGGKWRVARCNKGAGCGAFPGIRVHTVDKFEPRKYFLSTGSDFHMAGLEKDLQLTDEVYIRQKIQTTGNCSVANANGLELALLYLELESLIGQKGALELAQAIKKGRCEDSREGSLKEYMDCHQIPRRYPMNTELIQKIRDKLAKTAGVAAA